MESPALAAAAFTDGFQLDRSPGMLVAGLGPPCLAEPHAPLLSCSSLPYNYGTFAFPSAVHRGGLNWNWNRAGSSRDAFVVT
jgi:hypothetical protein